MNFRLKRTLIGVAAFSVLLPVASHAQVTKGQWVFDGFGRATRDGQGNTCVSSGGADFAFDSPECTTAMTEMKGARGAELAAREAARKERMAANEAAVAQNSKNPSLQNPGPYVKDGYSRAIIDGQATTCIKDGNFTTAAALQECERTAAFAAAGKRAPAEPFVKWADNTIEPGSALKPGDLGNYIRDGNGQVVRDGFGRNCVRDSRWTPAYATEACDPELFAAWRARQAPSTPAVDQTQPAQELAPRIKQPPPEIDKSTLGAAPAAEPAPAPMPEPAAAEPAPLADTSPGVAPPPEKKEEAKPIVDNTVPEFPVNKYAGGDEAAAAAALAPEDDGIPEEEPKAMMAEDEPSEGAAPPEEMAAEEETTPEMMLSEADRTLPEDGKPEEDPSMLAQEDEPADEQKTEVYADEEETTPEMMLSEADRTLPGDEAAVAATPLADTAPGVVPPAEKKDEPKAIVDSTAPEFPVTKYDGGGAAPAAPAAPVAAAAPEKLPQPVAGEANPAPAPTPRPDPSLPIVINVDKEGLFDFGKSKLKPVSVSQLDLVVSLLQDATYDKVTIVGYTDRIGSTKGNQKLSERRAQAAKKYLVQKGIDPSRIVAIGKGKADPVTGNTCKQKRKKDLIACLAPDRRIVITGKGTKPRN